MLNNAYAMFHNFFAWFYSLCLFYMHNQQCASMFDKYALAKYV